MINAVAMVRARGTRIGGRIYELGCQSQVLARLSKCKDSNAFPIGLEDWAAPMLSDFYRANRAGVARKARIAAFRLKGGIAG